MDKQKLFKRIVFLMLFIFLANNVALELYWYYSIWYFDMLMHFLGGLWEGLFFIYVFYVRKQILTHLFSIILFVLLIGILYEVFEFFLSVISHDPFSILDTTSDIFFDLLGGSFAILYFFKRITSIKENALQ